MRDEYVSDDDYFDSDSFLYVAKKAGLTSEDLQIMDIWQAMDYITEYVNTEERMQENQDKPRIKRAKQADFDMF